MTIDFIEWSQVQRVLHECPVLDAYESYDRQFSVPHRAVAPLVPLGYSDTTLQEALRVLRPGGLIFIEMVGELNSWVAGTKAS